MWVHYRRRLFISVSVGILTAIVILTISPALWDSALLLAWDAGVITWLALTFRRISQATAQDTMRQSRALEPATRSLLVIIVITATMGLWAAMALATNDAGRGALAQRMHLAAGFVAVFGAWVLTHVEFSKYYARLYYDEPDGTPEVAPTDTTARPFRKGLRFADGDLVDYWDFMYYAFTIAMCYTTPEVAVTAPWMRRVSLIHAILSFVFVLFILGFMVSTMDSLL